MRKILHVSHSLDTGGGPLYIKKVIQDIPQIDHYVAGNSGYYYSLFRHTLGSQKVTLLRGKILLYNIYALKKTCRDNSISVIHCHGRGAALYSRLLKLIKPRLKIIYTVHGFHPDTLNWIIKPFYILSEKLLYGLTDVVINVSLSEHERFLKQIQPANTKKIHYIPNYITIDDINPQPMTFTLDPDCVNFLYIGRLSHEKGVDILLEAWSKVEDPRCRLYIMGYGPLENLIHSNLKNSNIVYLGKVENAGSFISRFNSVIIPSRFEGMPFIGLESMISKTCAIVTPAVGLSDLFTANTAYMAKDFTPASLYHAIQLFLGDLYNNRYRIIDKVESNYSRVQAEFSRENASKIYEIYQSCLEAP